MALAANTAWEVRTGGDDTNGGGYVIGGAGTDFTQQNAAQAVLTTATKVHSTTSQINVSLGDYTVTNADRDNTVRINGGTATAGLYRITAVDIPNNRWTVDRSAGASGATVAGKMGGSFATPGIAGAAAINQNGNIIYIKQGTFVNTTNTQNVAAGRMQLVAATMVIGYNTNRFFGNGDTQPIIQQSVAGQPISGAGSLYNITLDGNGVSATTPTSSANFNLIACTIKGYQSTGSTFIRGLLACRITGNAADMFPGGTPAVFCEIDNNTASQTLGGNDTALINCIAHDNSGALIDGISLGAAASMVVNCTFARNGRDGLRCNFANNIRATQIINCYAEANGGYGFNNATAGITLAYLISCGDYNNTLGRKQNITDDINPFSLSGTAFVNGGAGDFSLNNISGQGTVLRAAGRIIPSAQTFLAGLTTAFPDIGAVQHFGGGGGTAGTAAYGFPG